MTDIIEGMKAPAFDMATADGGRVTLDGLKGEAVVVYFYPKADTPGCTTGRPGFSALIGDFEAANTVVIGVSRDPVKKLSRFAAKHDLKVALASDEPEDVTLALRGLGREEALWPRVYGHRARHLPDRWRESVVRRVWRKVSGQGSRRRSARCRTVALTTDQTTRSQS